jgi:hypothetical protein
VAGDEIEVGEGEEIHAFHQQRSIRETDRPDLATFGVRVDHPISGLSPRQPGETP